METTHTSQQLMATLKLLEDKGMTPKHFTALLASGILADVVDSNADLGNREAVRAALKLGTVMPETFRLTVDYSQSLEAMIAAGQYDRKNSDIIPKHFPIEGSGIVEFEARYFCFNRRIFSEDVVKKEIEAAGWKAAKIEHLLSHRKTSPEEQSKFSIIGLGSVALVGGRRVVPCLYRRVSRRCLGLCWFGFDWRGPCRFLAVRKVSAS